MAIAILASLAGREKTGKGCYVDFSMLDGQVSLLTLAAASYFALGEVPPSLGTEHPGRVPTATFCCSDGKYLHITASDQHWAPLCRALGLEAWGADAKFADNAKRVEHRNEIMPRLTQAIVGWKRDELIAALDAVEVPVGPVNDVAEILTDPHVAARGLVGEFDYPGVGVFKALGLPYKFDGFEDPKVGRRRRWASTRKKCCARGSATARKKLRSFVKRKPCERRRPLFGGRRRRDNPPQSPRSAQRVQSCDVRGPRGGGEGCRAIRR